MKINSGTILLLFLAIMCGIAGTYLIKKTLNKKPVVVEKAPPQRIAVPKKLTVPMASRILEAGQRIALDDIALVRLTRKELDDYGIKTAFMTNPEQIIGKTLKLSMKRGGTFDTKNFYPIGRGPGISRRIPVGKRAVTLSFLSTNALMGYAGSGQSVDILFHYGSQSQDGAGNTAVTSRAQPDPRAYNPAVRNPSGGNPTGMQAQRWYQNRGGNQSTLVGSQGSAGVAPEDFATKTIVQNAEILALGDQALPTNDANGIDLIDRVNVTLAVTPAEAEVLRVAEGHGELSLTLRGNDDVQTVKVARAIKLDDIIPRPKQLVSIPPPIRSMEIYQGNKFSTVQFNPANTISRRIVDTPRAYDPAAKDAYDPKGNVPWDGQPDFRPERVSQPVSYGLLNTTPKLIPLEAPNGQTMIGENVSLPQESNSEESGFAPRRSPHRRSVLSKAPAQHESMSSPEVFDPTAEPGMETHRQPQVLELSDSLIDEDFGELAK
jgi:Flp pilus assembly protein CpaB